MSPNKTLATARAFMVSESTNQGKDIRDWTKNDAVLTGMVHQFCKDYNEVKEDAKQNDEDIHELIMAKRTRVQNKKALPTSAERPRLDRVEEPPFVIAPQEPFHRNLANLSRWGLKLRRDALHYIAPGSMHRIVLGYCDIDTCGDLLEFGTDKNLIRRSPTR